MLKLLYQTVLAAVVMGHAVCADAQLANGGFEGGTTGQFGSAVIPDWSVFGGSGWHHNDAGLIHGGSLAIKTWSDDTGIFQDFSAVAGQTYTVSGFALSASNDALIGWDGVLKVEWYQTGIGQLGISEVGRFFGTGVDPLQTWKNVIDDVTAPAGADQGRVVIHLTQDGAGPRSGSLNWDDISVTAAAIPEPSTFGLLGLGLAGILGGVYRRKSFASR